MDLFRVYAIVFLADITVGIVIPTFPLYAESIGASVFLLSIVVTGMGIARILSQVYLGALADVKGRKIVQIIGLLLFTSFPDVFSLCKCSKKLVGSLPRSSKRLKCRLIFCS